MYTIKKITILICFFFAYDMQSASPLKEIKNTFHQVDQVWKRIMHTTIINFFKLMDAMREKQLHKSYDRANGKFVEQGTYKEERVENQELLKLAKEAQILMGIPFKELRTPKMVSLRDEKVPAFINMYGFYINKDHSIYQEPIHDRIRIIMLHEASHMRNYDISAPYRLVIEKGLCAKLFYDFGKKCMPRTGVIPRIAAALISSDLLIYNMRKREHAVEKYADLEAAEKSQCYQCVKSLMRDRCPLTKNNMPYASKEDLSSIRKKFEKENKLCNLCK